MSKTQAIRQCFNIEEPPSSRVPIEILAITAGVGNGWIFSPQVLRDSLPLWDGVETFVDHNQPPRSIRDLAGACSSPRWDESASGIRVSLSPCGPAAELLTRLEEDLHHVEGVLPKIGFSADLLFSAVGDTVTRIEKVFSVDLVTYPARGGSFTRDEKVPVSKSIYSKESVSMQEEKL
jgi:hypothetical protein